MNQKQKLFVYHVYFENKCYICNQKLGEAEFVDIEDGFITYNFCVKCNITYSCKLNKKNELFVKPLTSEQNKEMQKKYPEGFESVKKIRGKTR